MTNIPNPRFVTAVVPPSPPADIVSALVAVSGTAMGAYVKSPSTFSTFALDVANELGSDAKFQYIGDLDPREDIGANYLVEMLKMVCGDLSTVNAVASMTHPHHDMIVTLHNSPRWPTYYVLVQSSKPERDRARVTRALLFKMSKGV